MLLEEISRAPERRSALLQRSVVIACLSAHLGSLDSSINISFPSITAAFALEVTAIQWTVVGYVLTHGSLLLGCGSLADHRGHGRVLLLGLLVSAAAFIGCGAAPTYAWLVGARVVQGFGAALIFGTAPALVTLAVPVESRGRALGIYQMSAAIGYAVGPMIGGLLVDAFGWRATFLFRAPLALIIAGLTLVKLETRKSAQRGEPFDFAGALTLAAGIAGLLLTLSRGRAVGWSSGEALLIGAASLACFAGFAVVEKRAALPVVDLKLFRRPQFVIANLLSLMANCARFAIGLLLPYFVIEVLHYSAAAGGTLLLATYLLTIVAAPLAGKLSDRIGTARLSSLGLGVEGLGLWMVSRLDSSADYVSLAFALGIVGLGLGIFEAPNMSFIMGAISRDCQGVAGSVASMMRPLGIVCGATGWSVLFDLKRDALSQTGIASLWDTAQGAQPFQGVFLAAAALCFLAMVLSLGRRTKRRSVAE
jgi:EmrB/QacA subfamily drug resistance transporter